MSSNEFVAIKGAVTHDTAFDRGIKIPSNGAHKVYFVILVTIQRQFINVQYRDASKVVNMVRIEVYINIARTGIASLYSQCCNPIFDLGQPRGSEKYRFFKMWRGGGGRGGARGSYLAHGL